MDRRQWALCASNACFWSSPMRRQHPVFNGSELLLLLLLLLLYYNIIFYYCTHTYLTRGMSYIDVRGQR
jgi:hypothetical protein